MFRVNPASGFKSLARLHAGRNHLNPAVAASPAIKLLGCRSYHAPQNEMDFIINETYNLQKHYQPLAQQNGTSADKDLVAMMVGEMAKFSQDVLYPLNEGSDKIGCKHTGPHDVKTPPGFKDAYKQFCEGGWMGLSYPEKWGGQGLPQSLSIITGEMTATANWAWAMFPGLSRGCINTLLAHGTDELKEKFVPTLVAGTWTGTMCLTEPQCGSDLGQVATKAIPQDDGTYKITGTKIFISCGEHDMADNIMHCVLARLPNAPEGTRGISLFLVPKHKVSDDQVVSKEFNGVNIGRIEDKMGCHGSPTCEINFDSAEGYLIGTPNKGLNHMFTFINTSRLGTAIQGLAACELSYQNALWYAKDRMSMRSLTGVKNPDGPADPIIDHPDVRKMLLTQKAFSEGARSMIYECSMLQDQMTEAEMVGDAKKRRQIDDRMGFLTPILKGFLTEAGVEAANLGIQVYGGHGYIKSNKQEQILRDVRIAPVWEGTTGIQALDLLARKVLLQKLTPLHTHIGDLYGFSANLLKQGGGTNLRKHAFSLLMHTAEWQYNTYKVAAKGMLGSKDAIGIASVDYLMYAGYVNMAHHWLRMEVAAERALADPNRKHPKEFYVAKIQTSQFYFDNILPRTRSLQNTMFTSVDSIMGMHKDNFSFDHAL
eukprot:m.203731 g.203731  ORF g.203731 m.203731 type:complete len:654 (-) comp32862_c0_seq1:350-2311(-)